VIALVKLSQPALEDFLDIISLFEFSYRHVKKKLFIESLFYRSSRAQHPELVMGIPAGGLTAEQKAAYDRDGMCPVACGCTDS
jgi:hypothetical protein